MYVADAFDNLNIADDSSQNEEIILELKDSVDSLTEQNSDLREELHDTNSALNELVELNRDSAASVTEIDSEDQEEAEVVEPDPVTYEEQLQTISEQLEVNNQLDVIQISIFGILIGLLLMKIFWDRWNKL